MGSQVGHEDPAAGRDAHHGQIVGGIPLPDTVDHGGSVMRVTHNVELGGGEREAGVTSPVEDTAAPASPSGGPHVVAHLQPGAGDGVQEHNHGSILGQVVIISIVNTGLATITQPDQLSGEVVAAQTALVILLFEEIQGKVGPLV